MGIRGLTGRIRSVGKAWGATTIEAVVIDGFNLMHWTIGRETRANHLCFSNYDELFRSLEACIRQIRRHVRIHCVVFDGSTPPEKVRTCLQRKRKRCVQLRRVHLLLLLRS